MGCVRVHYERVHNETQPGSYDVILVDTNDLRFVVYVFIVEENAPMVDSNAITADASVCFTHGCAQIHYRVYISLWRQQNLFA